MEKKPFIIGKEGDRVAGVIQKPDGEGKIPVVIFCHGFTGNHIEPHFIFRRAADALIKKNIGSIRFDFRGSGDSDGDFKNMTVRTELEDVEKVFKYALSLPWVSTSRIGMLGYSMGGTITAFFAGKNPDRIKTICFWAPALKNVEVFTSHSTDKQEEKKLFEEGFMDVGGLTISMDFIKTITSKNSLDELENFKSNVTIVHGTEDESVPYKMSKEISEKRGYNLCTIEGANHTFDKEKWIKPLLKYTSEHFSKEL
ncbi:MAG: alpha/beta fold hydrolase [Kosmotogaceae bacterium]